MPTTEIQLKRGDLARWATVNPVLKLAELGFEKDTKKLKIGDGVTAWNALPYLSLGSVISGTLYFVDEAALIAARDPESEDRYAGEFAFVQGLDFPTIWTWDPITEEWADTGNPVNFTVDQEIIPGSVNALASYIIISLLEGKLNTDGTITQAQVTGLVDALTAKLTATDFLTYLVANTASGSGISLAIVDGKLRITNTGDGGTGGGDFIDIGGLPLDNTALAAEFAKYQKPPVWTPVTPSAGVVTLPAVNGTNDYYEYTESGPVTLAHSGTFEDAGYKRVRVTLSSASHTVTLGAGYVDKRGAALPSIELTGAPGDEVDYWLDRKGSNWYVYKDGDESTGTGLPSGGTTGQVLKKQSNTDGDADWEDETGGGGNGETIQKTFTQTTHGFVVGNVLRHNGTIFTKAQANSSANSEVVGIVSEVVDANNFVLTLGGFVDITGLGLTANTTYFLSNTTAGELTDTAPTTIGHVSKPLLITTTTTEAYFINFRGVEITDPSDIGTGFISLTTPTGAAPTITLDATGVTSPIINRKLTVDNTSTGDITFATTAFTNGVIYTVVVKNNDAISRNLILPAGASYIPYNTADSKSLILPSGRRQILAFTYDGAEYHITRLPQ